MPNAARELVQEDLFGPSIIVGAVTEPSGRRDVPRRRPHSDTQCESHEAYKTAGKDKTIDARCLDEINGNSRFGRTRQGIADRTGLKLQSVCGAVNRLVKAGLVFEPVTGFDEQGDPIHLHRDRRTIVVGRLYEVWWIEQRGTRRRRRA